MLFLFFVGLVKADLPVHCLRHHVEGAWRFHIGALTPERTSCGHESPDTEVGQPNRTAFLQTAATSVDVLMSSPNVAHEVVSGKKGQEGTWTMIYDEGFFLETADKEFFAFNHFIRSDPESVKNYFPSRVHGKKVYRSICGQTEVGWYKDKQSGHWGCFVGERTDVKDPAAHHDFLSFLDVPEDPTYHLALTQEDHERKAALLNEQLTKSGAQWEAASYPQFAGMSIADLNRQAGPASYAQTSVGEHKKSFMSIVRRTEEVPAAKSEDKSFRKKFPESLDWKNVNGTNWLTSVTDQGDCGSCYVVSSTNMLTANKRINAQDAKSPPLSISLPLYCSDLNQGCQGGYPFLNALWGQSVGLVDDDCMDRYHVHDGEQCPAYVKGEKKRHSELDKCMQGKEHTVSSFGYVGGFYGGCSEEGMMEALQKGPITIALEPGMDFMYYKSGVYSSVNKDLPSPVAEEWVKVDHAVLMTGYGVDTSGSEPKPYWILQNSWGPDWGEDGFMRIARGENESGVEFQAVEASVTSASTSAPIHAFLKQFK